MKFSNIFKFCNPVDIMTLVGMKVIALIVAASIFLGILTVIFQHSINSRRLAVFLKQDIMVHVMNHRMEERTVTDFWKRPGGPAVLHHCKPLSNKHPTVHATTRFAVVSILTSDRSRFYTLSAIKLAKSLRWWFPPEQMDLVMLVTDGFGISTNIDSDFFFNVMEMENAGWNIICKVPVFENPRVVNANRFHDIKVYSKLNTWALTEYEAVLYLDSDTLVIRNPVRLFTEHLDAMKRTGKMLGAVIDRPESWSQGRFNAGVFMLVPTIDNRSWTFPKVVESIVSVPHDVDWAEQGLLNALFDGEFYRLPYIYNGNLVCKKNEPAFWSYHSSRISIVHYTVAKGWMSPSHLSMVSGDYDVQKYFSCWYNDVDEFCELWDEV